ncbi:ankyrin repeat and IBR domain-containing protein 1-like [Hetaerina americana]|uniref:ankyrin repeat and IBR domain-containing protein 1-like n=1 Tax=Hetaerina americana TaxID=62018 RepID=UPI003A7F1BA2
MGSASSKFKKYLQHGDEFAAMQVFQSSPELRKNLDPNLSYGDNHHHNTALHYAAKHGMKHLLRTFLNDLTGNPNKRNGSNETALHCACLPTPQKSPSAHERRAACVALLLQWRGAVLPPSGERERVDLHAQDEAGNTALHNAAASGLRRCVELLIGQGSPLFVENHDRLTPCDLAVRALHLEVAQLLETKMVFAEGGDTVNEAELTLPSNGDEEDESDEVYSGLRTQDLQEAKDRLLVETSDMLHIPLFTAEALLRDNEWSREALLEKWMKEPVLCCQLAGVQPPASALHHSDLCPPPPPLSPPPGGGSLSRHDMSSVEEEMDCIPSIAESRDSGLGKVREQVCEICTDVIPEWDEVVHTSCEHRFCTSCWEAYLTVKIREGDAHRILCPAFHCHYLVPAEIIERLVSPEMARRYLQFDIKAFVEGNRSIKWCPMPGCGRAVRLPEVERVLLLHQHAATPSSLLSSPPPSPGWPPPVVSHAVDCGRGHLFCWECLGEAHAPSGCAQWREWRRKILEVRPEELRPSPPATALEMEDAANCLWLVTNSKPCPNCRSRIQKNEGCNHMKCSKCKFDFCWVCLESWKKHSSATGGYFRCNRYEAVNKADEKRGILISEATLRNQKMQELNRFLHYYTRFKNHENSQHMEEPLLRAVRKKMAALASSLIQGNAGEELAERGTRFIEEGVKELLKARRVLCGSYVYGYYLRDNGYNKAIFEFMQNELEEVTEKLSETLARPYLRTPRGVIIQTSALTRRRRREFVRAVSRGLVPPETPPPVRHIAEGMAPRIPGTSEDDCETERLLSILGRCARIGCARPRARNPRTGGVHSHCSLWCSQADTVISRARAGTTSSIITEGSGTSLGGGSCGLGPPLPITGRQRTGSGPLPMPNPHRQTPPAADYNTDLVIALEMSRLQMIEDESRKRQRVVSTTSGSTNPTSDGEVGIGGEGVRTSRSSGIENRPPMPLPPVEARNEDQQLKLAIHLSLQEASRSCCSGDDVVIVTPPPHDKEGQGEGGPPASEPGVSPRCSSGDSLPTPPRLSVHLVHEGGEDGRFRTGDLHADGLFEGEGRSVGLSSIKGRCRAGRGLGLMIEGGKEDIGVASRGEGGGGAPEKGPDPSPLPASSLLTSALLDLDAAPPAPALPPTAYGLDTQTRSLRHNASSTRSLRIRIRKSPGPDTDSSNDYESETGIPRSPTLFISGVSISRTPEPRSPAAAAAAAAAAVASVPGSIISSSGRQSRSSSLTVPTALSPEPRPPPRSPLSEPGSLRSRSSSLVVPGAVQGGASPSAPSALSPPHHSTPPPPSAPSSPSLPASPGPGGTTEGAGGGGEAAEREAFGFPRSSTDGALSSVLHVQEGNLGSDDFHEALFLERSPRGGSSASSSSSSRRRRRSRRERDVEELKEDDSGKEATSAL